MDKESLIPNVGISKVDAHEHSVHPEPRIKITEKHVYLDGREYDKFYLEHIMEIERGSIDNALGNDMCLHHLLMMLAVFPELEDVWKSRFDPKVVKEAEEKMLKRGLTSLDRVNK